MSARVFHQPDGDYRFHFKRFQDEFRDYCARSSIRINEGEVRVGEAVGAAGETVHSWRNATYGPAGIETARALAAFFEIPDQDYFLYKTGGDTPMTEETTTLSDRQLDALKRIYDAVIVFLDEYVSTDGFNDYWDVIEEKYGERSLKYKDALYRLADDRLHTVELVLLQEQFDLHTIDLTELEDFIYEELPGLYRDQLDTDLRMNAVIKEKSGEYSVDYSSAYDFAMDKLNAIIFHLTGCGND